MVLNVEFKVFDIGYDIEKIYPILRSISFKVKRKTDTIVKLNFNPYEVDYLIHKDGDYIFIEAVGETFRNQFIIEQYYIHGDGSFMNGIFKDCIDIVDIDIDFGVDTTYVIICVENLSVEIDEYSGIIYFSKSVLDKYNIKLSIRNKEEL